MQTAVQFQHIMSEATIRRHVTTDPFARVKRAMLEDSSLSWKAKGILSYLLGKPDNWQLQEADLVNRGTDGRDAVRAGIAELEAAGYLRKEVIPKRRGQFSRNVWHVTDTPGHAADSLPLPCREIRRGLSDAENPTLSKKEETKKEEKTSAPAAAEPKTGDHAAFVRLWHDEFKGVFGDAYIFAAGKDGTAVKRLLRVTESSPASLVGLAKLAWSAKDDRRRFFRCTAAMTICGFASAFVEIREELKKGGLLAPVINLTPDADPLATFLNSK